MLDCPVTIALGERNITTRTLQENNDENSSD
jgi:hypothetical protein